MKPSLRLVGPLLAGLLGSASALAAQAAGIPVRNAGIGTGISVAADVGVPNGAMGKGVALGATGTAGLGPVGVSATVARWDPSGAGAAITSVAGTGNLKILGGPLIPLSVTLQGGLGRYRLTTGGGHITTLHFPAGVGVALTIPNPAFSIKPWLAPRLDVVRTTESGGTGQTHTDANFGISGGVDVGFLGGLTIRAMYDRVQGGGGPGVHPSVLSLGLGFKVGT